MSEIRCSTLMIEPSKNCYDICVISNRCGALKEWEREKQKGESMSDLKPCPFCGGKAILRSWEHPDGNHYTVGCPKCYVDMGEYETIEEVTKVWNRRVKEEHD